MTKVGVEEASSLRGGLVAFIRHSQSEVLLEKFLPVSIMVDFNSFNESFRVKRPFSHLSGFFPRYFEVRSPH